MASPVSGSSQEVAGSPFRIGFDIPSLWRATWVVIFAIWIWQFLRFFVTDGSSVIFTVIMSLFASIALEPAVGRLSQRMRRSYAAALVLLLLAVALCGFFLAFGNLLAAQLGALAQLIPQAITNGTEWLHTRWGLDMNPSEMADQLGVNADTVQSVVLGLAGGAFGLIGNIVSSAFGIFTFAFFTYYLTADLPRLRRWLAELFPPRGQVVFLTIWELTLTKVGGYVAARCVLALICGGCTSAFLAIIGMDFWLPLGIWTGIVAQFVPTIGTYLAIALPVLVGLLSPEPIKGVAALVFAIIYQQIENVTLEPRISAAAVQVHPAVSFASAMLGGALFGVSGALVGVPVAATVMAVFDIFRQRYTISAAADEAAQAAAGTAPSGSGPLAPAHAASDAVKAVLAAQDEDSSDGNKPSSTATSDEKP